MSTTWHAVDRCGLDLATGRPPRSPGAPDPAAAVASAPVIEWPLDVVDDAGRRLGLADVLGPGGDIVADLVAGLVTPHRRPVASRLAELAADTPAGPCRLPVGVVSLRQAAEAARSVDTDWLAAVADRRSAPRPALALAGRSGQLDAALHVAMLVAVEHLRATDDGVDVRAASGVQLWLLAGMVAGALAGGPHDHFSSWAELLGSGLWPIGPSGGSLVIGDPGR